MYILFSDPYFRLKRIQSFFESKASLTDPVAFLTRMHYRGIRCKRPATGRALERLASLFHEELNVESIAWLERDCDFRREWAKLSAWQRRIAAVVLDAVRHMIEVHQISIAPLDTPALILFDRPDRFCTRRVFSRWAKLMDVLFAAGSLHSRFLRVRGSGVAGECGRAQCAGEVIF
jgi:hypothetical protein